MRGKTIYRTSIACAFSLFVISCDNEAKQTNVTTQNIPLRQNNSKNESFAEIASYEKQLGTDSLNIEVRLNLASILYSTKEFEKAIYHFSIVNKINKKNLEALISLGNIYYDIQQNEKAIDYYEKALAIDNKNINVRCDLATCYLNIKKPEKALEILKENIVMNFNHTQSHYNLSIVYKQLGKTKEAEEELKIFNKLNTH